MSVSLDHALMFLTKRRTHRDRLTQREKIALHWFWREGVKATVLAKVFGVSKNTVYYTSLTGDADSYPQGSTATANEIAAIYDRLGAEKIRRRYVTDAMVREVNEELARAANDSR